MQLRHTDDGLVRPGDATSVPGTDAHARILGEAASMVVHIWVQTVSPLTGYAAEAGGQAIRFAGWLGLLRVLSESVGPAPVPSNLLREFAARGDSELREHVRDVGLHGALGDE